MKPFPVSRRAGFLKLLLGTVLLLTLLALVDLRRLWAGITGAEGVLLGLALAAACGAVVVLEAWRFQTGFADWGLSFIAALKITLAGQFVGSFTPGAVGAEGYKVYAVRQPGQGMVRALVRLALLRILGALAVVTAAGVAWRLAPNGSQAIMDRVAWSKVPAAAWMAGAAVAAALGLSAVFLGIRRLAAWIREALTEVRLRQVGEIFVLSLGVALLRGVSLTLLVRSFGETARFGDLLVVVALSVLSGMLPVSPAGLGVQEGVLAGCLVLLGIPPPSAVAISLLNRAFLWVFAAGGGWVLAVTPVKHRPDPR